MPYFLRLKDGNSSRPFFNQFFFLEVRELPRYLLRCGAGKAGNIIPCKIFGHFIGAVHAEFTIQVMQHAGNFLPQVHLRNAHQPVGTFAVFVAVKLHQVIKHVGVRYIHLLHDVVGEEAYYRINFGISPESVIIIVKSGMAKYLPVAGKAHNFHLIVRPQNKLLHHAALHKKDPQYRVAYTKDRMVFFIQCLIFLLFKKSRPLRNEIFFDEAGIIRA